VYIVDGEMEPVPVGVVGEICLGGYERQAEGMEERFVSDPYISDPYIKDSPVGRAWICRTGGLGKWKADGGIEFAGWKDLQVRVRGQRVDLGRIEARLKECAGVKEAVVEARDAAGGGTRLVAYYTLEADESGESKAGAEELRQHLAERLPEHMVPAAYVPLEKLPLTADGKPDRMALPAPEDAHEARGYEAPQSHTEKMVAEIWAEVLQVERVGRQDDFFDLGGRSLLAVQIIARLRQVLGVEVGINDLFARPVLSDFVRGVESAQQSQLPAIAHAERGEYVPLSFAQQRLWFLTQMEGVSEAYHIPLGVRLHGKLDRAVLERALDRLVARHEALRTTFVMVDGESKQKIAPVAGSRFHLVEHDLRRSRNAKPELKRLLREEACAAFDLEAGPLVRGRLIRHGKQDYALLITMHHIVSDGWSMGILFSELNALYAAFARGAEDPLPELPVQYADYALWQRKWIDGAVLAAQVEYWKQNLVGVPEVLELPADHPRPKQQDFSGAVLQLAVSKKLTAGLKKLSTQHGTTLYMTLLAGWAMLLSRLSGQQDIVIGTPVANRGHVEIEKLIGFFVNTLVLRVDLSGQPTIGEVLERVKQQAIGAQQHQEIPFEQVVEIVKPVRNLAHSPLFQVMFAWQDVSIGNPQLTGLEIEPLESTPHVVSKFDLTLSLQETGNRIVGALEYSTALFKRGSIERYARYYLRLLEGMIGASEARSVHLLPILSEKERQQLVYDWNRTEAVFPVKKCVHQLFEEQVRKTPEAVAVEFLEAKLSYAELNIRANCLAHHLRETGVKPDDRVAICLERGLEMVVALLGVLKAGGAYVPLDPAYPMDRLQYLLEDSNPIVLLTDNHMKSRFAGLSETLPTLDITAVDWNTRAKNLKSTAVGVAPHHLAYIIYTSGSTGMPKGVMVQHGNVVRLLAATQHWFEFDATDVWTLFHSYAFDFSVWEIWGALLYGGRLQVVSKEVAHSPEDFYRLVCEAGVTVLNQTPSAFRQLVAAQASSRHCHRLRYVIFGGEALEVANLRPWFEQNPGVKTQLVNMYGITETTVHVTYRVLGRNDVEHGGSPIGCRIPDLRMYILDENGEAVPVGVVGELYVGGAGVARGYRKRGELTAERFVPDPFIGDKDKKQAGERMYKTGDMGKWSKDGQIEFIGRNDSQVKVRGFRIELGEIEARLGEYEEVKEAVVVLRQEAGGEKRLVAYYTERTGVEGAHENSRESKVGAENLRSHLAGKLPEYMVPAAYVRLERLPLTVNGKLDRKALPAPEGDAFAVRKYEAPEGEAERLIAGIWAEVLKVERVGRHDNFFALGGHSLLAMPVIERMRQAGLQIDVRELFATSTMAELAANVSKNAKVVVVPENRIPAGCVKITPEMLPLIDLTDEEIERVVNTVPGGAANVQDIYPLAPLQEGMFFHHLMAKDGDPYLVALQLSFPSRARLDNYVKALQAVVARHDILRTSLAWEGLREPVQVVWRQAMLLVEEVELDITCGDMARQLYARFNPRHYRIELSQAPLLRIYITEDRQTGSWLLMQLIHHMVDDNTSFKGMLEEIQAYMLGETDKLPTPLPFRNLVAQARLGVSREEHEAFFREMLGDVEEPTAPFGLVNIQGDGTGMEESRILLDKDVSERLREQARRLRVGAASLCHVAWAQVLALVSGRQDVVFGTVLFGRMDGGAGAERVMGPFINTLPVRICIGNEGTEATVQHTHRLLADLLRHEHAPLGLAQRASGVPAPAPLFSALLNYRHAGGETGNKKEEKQAWDGIRVLQVEESSNYPIALSVDDFGKGFQLSAQTAPWIGAQRICEYMGTALKSLVKTLESAPAAAISTLKVLGGAEQNQVLHEWNETRAAYPGERYVHGLFEEHVRRTPELVAAEFGDKALSYGELNERANRLANYLRELGVKPEDRVGICLERGLEMLVALLGVLKAGGAYVPLDPVYPVDRLAYMIEDSQSAILLTQSRFRTRLPANVSTIIELDADQQIISQKSADAVDSRAAAENLAYVIYTSGSTGKPKGVAVEHRQVCNQLFWAGAALSLSSTDRVLQKASFSFDASILEIFLPLACGAQIIIAESGGEHDVDYLVHFVIEKKITYVDLAPALLEQLLEHPAISQWSSLRIMSSGADVLKAEVVKSFYQRLPGTLWNTYGPTEATVQSTFTPCAESELRVPIGKPIANTQVYVLNSYLDPVPVGVAGELFIGGMGVTRGYLEKPALTAERFIPDPFSKTAGARLYRTGDLVSWRTDGNLDYLGRADFQVKIRGFRIELGEIEAALQEHSRVEHAVVMARQEASGEKRLVAYYTVCALESEVETGTENADVGAEELRAYLSDKSPSYMVPAAYVRLERLPLTPNGKLDRNALPAPDGDAYAVQRYEPPQEGIESLVAGTWAEVLHVERVGRQDNFFALGGHSLLAVRVVAQLRQSLGLEIGVNDLFMRPVLNDFVLGLKDAKQTRIPAITRAEHAEHVPLSFAQQRLWFLAQIEGVSKAYHVPLGVRLRGRLDKTALRRALDRLIARHEILRTTFAAVEGEPYQQIAPLGDGHFPLMEHDLRGHHDAKSEWEQLASEEAGTLFDLETGPLIRGRLVRQSEEEHALLITMHHIISDGWSLGVLFNELSTLYAVFASGEGDPLPEPHLQYADYAVWQRKWIEGEVLAEQAEHWRKTLAGMPEVLELPADHARPVQQDYVGAAMPLMLDEKLTAGLKEMSARNGITLFMTLLAGWAVLLARLSGQEDLAIGTPVANRQRVEIENIIGFFVNTLVLRLDVTGRPTVGEVLERVKSQVIAAQQHQDIPFEQIVEMVQPARSLAHSPLFQVMFVWQNVPEGKLELPGLEILPLQSSPHEVSKFDITLALQESQGGIAGGLEYATALFESRTIERYAGYYRRLLEGMVAGGKSQAVDGLTMMGDAERQQVLHQWNATRTKYSRHRCIHELFEQQVKKTPEAVAVAEEGRELSYRELNARANQMAHYLRTLGVTPDARVAICAERSLEMVVGLLGILKAGGSYVPLDPVYPDERLSYMLEDSKPVALLIQGHLQGRFNGTSSSVPRIDLTAEVPLWSAQPVTNPDRDSIGLTPRNLAYVIYTSGSTGLPKGAMNEHQAIANRLIWMQRAYKLGGEDAILQKTPFSFDVSVWEFFWPLLAGARLVMAQSEGHRDPGYLIETIRSSGITSMHFVPPMLQVFLEHSEVGECSTLKRVICSGEALPPMLVKRFGERLPHAELHNLYGPTEAAVDVTAWFCSTDKIQTSIPIGRPIANTQMYVLDKQGEPVPVGVVGELYIGGVQVGRGYVDRAEMTAERFVPDSFAKELGARMYRTGDLGRWREDGSIEYLGRNDFQVKIRGFRIELGEIEARLAEHPEVREAVVVDREEAGGTKRLIGYVVANGATELTSNELRNHLKQRMPEYMVPSAFVKLERLPLTPNGKLDRKELPLPDDLAMQSGTRFVAPRTELEKQLAEVWEKLLGKRPVGVTANFFELGGHSIQAVRLIARLERQFGKRIPVAALFQNATVEGLAKVLAATDSSTWSPLVPIQPNGSQAPLFFVHTVGGQVYSYMELSRHLGQDQPFYGLQSRHGIQGMSQLNRLEEMATEYVAAIRGFQPVGPYRLGGWSMGGVVAFEMARQLREQDQEVSLLALLDSHAPPISQAEKTSLEIRETEDLASFALHLGFTYQQLVAAGNRIFGRAAEERLACLLSEGKSIGLLTSEMTMEDLGAMLDVFKLNSRLMEQYQGGSYDGIVTLFRVESDPGSNHAKTDSAPQDPQRGWNRLAAGVKVVGAPGDHFTMIQEPHVKILARELLACIAAAAITKSLTAAS
jgi:amino acid adenylation domain-containing protein